MKMLYNTWYIAPILPDIACYIALQYSILEMLYSKLSKGLIAVLGAK